MIEVGKRLLQAKKEVPHGEWIPWLKNEVNYTERTAQKFMRIADEYGNTNAPSYLGSEKLWKLLDVPTDEREAFIVKPHELPSGETKTVIEMTTRELQQAIKAQKDAERRAEGAEQKTAEYERKFKIADNALQEIQSTADALDTVNDELEFKNEQLKTANELLVNKLKTAGDPIIVETPVQVFPHDYARIKKELAELKAHQQGMTLQQLSEVNETCRRYAKTLDEEERLSRVVNKVLGVLRELPSGVEINELARCYLKCSPADTSDEIIITCSAINDGVQRLIGLGKAIQDSTKLRVVKK